MENIGRISEVQKFDDLANEVLEKVYEGKTVLNSSDLKFIKSLDSLMNDFKVSNRNLFLKLLFTVLKKQPYGVLNESRNFKLFNDELNNLDILVCEAGIKFLKKFFKVNPFCEMISETKRFGVYQVYLTFNGEERLKIKFHYNYLFKGLHFALTRKALLNAELNAFGIKQIGKIDSLEYLYCFFQLKGKSIPMEVLNKILPPLKSEKNRLFSYINSKYDQKITSVEDLSIFRLSVQNKVLKIISNKAENRGGQKFKNIVVFKRDQIIHFFSTKMNIHFPNLSLVSRSSLVKSMKSILAFLLS